MYTFIKSIHFLSLFLLLGGPIFWFFIWRPIASYEETPGDKLWHRVRLGTALGAVGFVLSGWADALRAGAQVFPLDQLDLVWLFLTSSRFGQMSLLKTLVVISWVLIALLPRARPVRAHRTAEA